MLPEERKHWVTVRDPDDPERVGWLLGPYTTCVEAVRNIERGRALANQVNSWACFMGFGTASLPLDAKQPTPLFQIDQKVEDRNKPLDVAKPMMFAVEAFVSDGEF